MRCCRLPVVVAGARVVSAVCQQSRELHSWVLLLVPEQPGRAAPDPAGARTAGTLVTVTVLEASESVTNLALLPGFLDPVNLLNSFGAWVLVGLLLVVFIESGLLFPLLPGDSLLFTAGLVVAGKSAEVDAFAPLWVLLVTIPIAAILGDQVGYLIGTKGGTALFKSNDAKIFKKQYIDESHAFFLRHGPVTIVLARFVPIVRTYAPLVAGAAKMPYRVFITYNVIGGVLWGAGITLLGYLLGQIGFIRDNVDLIFLLIVFISVVPILIEIGKRFLASRRGETAPEGTAPESTATEGTDSNNTAANNAAELSDNEKTLVIDTSAFADEPRRTDDATAVTAPIPTPGHSER